MPLQPPPSAHPSASISISWNTAVKPSPAPAPAKATVSSVDGTRVTLRLADGTTRRYIATAREAAALKALVGQTIAFRVDPRP